MTTIVGTQMMRLIMITMMVTMVTITMMVTITKNNGDNDRTTSSS